MNQKKYNRFIIWLKKENRKLFIRQCRDLDSTYRFYMMVRDKFTEKREVTMEKEKRKTQRLMDM